MLLSKEEIRLLDLIEQDYYLTRFIPSGQVCNDKYKIPLVVYRNAFKKEEFRAALNDRGIIIRGTATNGLDEFGFPVENVGVLTPEQLAVLNSLLDMTDNRSRKKKLQDFKVTSQQYEAWLRDPAVQNYLRERTEGALQDNQHEAHLALIDRVRQGDVPAIKYFNEVTGRYSPNQSIDVGLVLTRVTEIIMRNVRDSELQAQIADELIALAAGVGVAAIADQARQQQPKAISL